jgi:hypothetical protein
MVCPGIKVCNDDNTMGLRRVDMKYFTFYCLVKDRSNYNFLPHVTIYPDMIEIIDWAKK